MAQVDKTKLIEALVKKIKNTESVSVNVGYTQAYALYVHENREAYHHVGRAGYLLDVAREIKDEIFRVAATTFKKTGNLGTAILLAGLRLQRESQLNVPIDTGALKGSAFTRQE